MNISVYRLQTDCFMSFSSDVIGLSNLHLNNLQGICLPFGKIRISNEDNTATCVFRKIWHDPFDVDQFLKFSTTFSLKMYRYW